MPLVVLGSVFAVDIAIYGVYYLIIHITKKYTAKKENQAILQN
jgi:hypothetical protein